MATATVAAVKYKNVLIARFSALGDVAMTVPVVYSVCNANPGTRFIMITQQVASTLFVNAPSNLVVEGVDTKVKYHGVAGIKHLKDDLMEKYSIDAFVDLHDVLRTWLLAFFLRLSGVPCKRLKKGRSGKRALTRKHNKRMLPLISSRARYREVFHRMGFSFESTFVSLYGDSAAKWEDFSDISAPKQTGEQWIGIAPFAKHKGKIYPLDLMEKVVAEVSTWKNTRIFLFGAGDEERAVLHNWAEKYDSITSLAEKRNGFPKELALLSHCDVMLSMDSANMHLASLVRVPVVSVWGATHPYCGFLGWHQDERNAVQLNMACRPCSVFGNKPCMNGDFFCLKGISPQLIISHLRQVLEPKP